MGMTGESRVDRVMEWLWRWVTAVLVPILIYELVQLAAIQASTVELRARVLALEERTAQIPPPDYRGYLESKFTALQNQADLRAAVVDKRLDEIAAQLRIHSLGREQP